MLKKFGKNIFEALLFIFFINGLFWPFGIIFKNVFKFLSIILLFNKESLLIFPMGIFGLFKISFLLFNIS